MQQQILEGLGYRVTPAVSSLDALETFRSAPDQFDILITDMTIPDMTGENLAKAIKEIRPDVPVILCTGFSRQIDIHREDIKIEALLTKPVDKTKMAKVIRRLLDEAKLKK
ncbi:MAG: response regulator [Desulfobacteraceae bacterium]|nr:response regulator [Desulfobacteraceae bacterium]